MDDAGAVGVVDALGGAADHHDALLDGELAGDGAERLAVDVLHRDVDLAVDLADLVDPAHAIVIDPRLGARLADQPANPFWIIAVHELDRDLTAQPRIDREEDFAHAALAEEPDAEVAVPGDDREHRDVGRRRDGIDRGSLERRGGRWVGQQRLQALLRQLAALDEDRQRAALGGARLAGQGVGVLWGEQAFGDRDLQLHPVRITHHDHRTRGA